MHIFVKSTPSHFPIKAEKCNTTLVDLTNLEKAFDNIKLKKMFNILVSGEITYRDMMIIRSLY